MAEQPTASAEQKTGRHRANRRRPLKALWGSIRGPLRRSRLVKSLLSSVIAAAIRFIDLTNRRVAGSSDPDEAAERLAPAISALWHGQHILAPMVKPRRKPMVALFSRSADAELNALVAEKLGFEVVRGSGGRPGTSGTQKGGAKALISMKRFLDQGTSVSMIADIPHGTPREAGAGIVILAKISGRPIVPIAVATSRRKVLRSTWDQTTINLPFGRSALIIGEPIYVPADADSETVEQLRQEVTNSLNQVTEKAYRLVDAVA